MWWLLAKVHKRLGHKSMALTALNAALDLQPPAADAALIKAALDKLHLDEVGACTHALPFWCQLAAAAAAACLIIDHAAGSRS